MPSTLPSNVFSMRMYSCSRDVGSGGSRGSRPTPPGRPLQELSTAKRPVNAVPAASSLSSRGRATGRAPRFVGCAHGVDKVNGNATLATRPAGRCCGSSQKRGKDTASRRGCLGLVTSFRLGPRSGAQCRPQWGEPEPLRQAAARAVGAAPTVAVGRHNPCRNTGKNRTSAPRPGVYPPVKRKLEERQHMATPDRK